MIKRVERVEGTRWQVYGKRNGRKVYVGTYDSKREATEVDEEYRVTQRKIADGELPEEVDLKRTLRDATTEWLDSLAKQKSRSHEQYKVRSNLYVLPTLGDVPIAKFSKTHVMRWRDEQSTRFAPATVNGNLVCLSSAFSYFVDRQWLDVNPCHGVSYIERPDGVYTWIKTREEMTKLLVACPKGIRELVIVALATGMRLDELLHLQWADVDIERRLISVHRGRQGTVKSGKVRRIPILDTLLPFIREQALMRDGATLLFPGNRVGRRPADNLVGARIERPLSKPSVQRPFKQAAARAGLPTSLRFHDLRHTFASHWVLDGGDIFRLSKILGHANVTITQKVYAHLVPEAWEQDHHRVAFKIPETGTVYALTRRKQAG